MDVTFLSLFAGIGGLDLGLERAGMKCVGQVEIDPFCLQVLQKHWPDVPRWEDVREFPPPGVEIVSPDLIAAGFPCVDISYAGKGDGIHGTDSGLYWEALRVIREFRPTWVLLENVPALLIRGMGDILGSLAESGYDISYSCLSAAALGAPHIRERVFLIGRQADAILGDVSNSYVGEGEPGWEDGRMGGIRQSLIDFRATVGRDAWACESSVVRVANGVPRRMDRLRGLGNAVCPPVAQFIGEQIMKVAEEEWLRAQNVV